MPPGVEKAVKDGTRSMVAVTLEGTTIPHTVEGHFGAAQVVLVPAGPGTGVIAGAAVRAVCEACGIRDILTKSFGSTNPINLVKATIEALEQLRSQERSRAAAGSLAVMNLNDVHRGIHKNRARKRIGRGTGLGPRQDRRPRPQGPGLARRLSRSRRSSRAARCRWSAAFPSAVSTTVGPRRWPSVNVGDLEKRFASGEEVTPETLEAKDLVKGSYDVLKVLGDGELTKKLKISAHRFSRSALEKIEKAGGQAVVLPGKEPVVKNKMKVKR